MFLRQQFAAIIARAFGLLALGCTLAGAATPGVPLDVIDALRAGSVVSMHLSPDSKHIAAIIRKDETTRIVVLDSATLVARKHASEHSVVTRANAVRWFDDRLLVVESHTRGAVLIDLDNKEVIDAGDDFIRKISPDSAGNARFLFQKGDWGSILRLNVGTKEKTTVDHARPPETPVDWTYDSDGEARVATTINTAFWSDDTRVTHWYRESAAHKWEKLATFPYLDDYWTPLYFSADNKSLVVSSRQGRDTHAYFSYDLKERKITEMLAGHPTQDIAADFDTDREDARYVLTRGIKTEIQWFDSSWAALQRAVDTAIPGHLNLLQGDAKKRVLILSSSDRDPGKWLVLDVATSTLREVARVKPEIDPEKMQPKQIVQYKARDGLTIPAYLTHAPGTGLKPAVIFIHGGPHVRDYWDFDAEVQMLASRGYTVFQPQFRGSGGFGKRYMEAGYGQWGLAMQDDISDGVRWLVEQGHADPARICIYGASYGGYAAMWGMAKTPELYRCGASFAGVSDLQYMFKDDSDVNSRATGRLERNRMFGEAAAQKQVLDQVSPLKNAARIGAPILVAHGEWDQRVPIDHSYKMVRALKSSNKEFEWLQLEQEGHGIYYEKNRLKFYQALFKLIERTIGAPAPASPAAP